MAKKRLKIKFNFAQGKLAQLGDKLIQNVERDLNDLSRFGIDHVYLSNFNSKVFMYKNCLTDEELLVEIKIATTRKDTFREEATNKAAEIAVRIRNYYGRGSAEYEALGYGDLNVSNDSDAVRILNRIARQARLRLSALSTKGLTSIECDFFEEAIKRFDESIEKKIIAEEQRKQATEERRRLGNELFEIIAEVCDFGKTYYGTRDAVRYEDYLMYDRVVAEQSVSVQVIKVNEQIEAIKSGIIASTVIYAENAGTTVLAIYTSQSATNLLPANAVTLQPGDIIELPAADISTGTYGKLFVKNESVITEGKVLAYIVPEGSFEGE